jgi:hypothetical protein
MVALSLEEEEDMKALTLSIVVTLMLTAVSCGEDRPAQTQPAAEPSFPIAINPYEPKIDPADFVAGIDNPYLPFKPGSRWVYEGMTEEGPERGVVTVTNETKEILGVECVVVKDVVTLDGSLIEKTFDWYAQDRFGNVWYMGEDSMEFEDGKMISRKGSWEAGVDGAEPGILMLGEPEVGDRYRQEFYKGKAEDFAEVIELGATVTIPLGDYDDVLVTEDWNPLEPNTLENKFYAPGVGVILERHMQGPKEEFKLVQFTQA